MVLIIWAVTAQLMCVFVFAYANCLFSYAAVHMHFLLQVNVFVLGRTYLCLAKELCISMPEIGEYTL